jgi:hypothetical protein
MDLDVAEFVNVLDGKLILKVGSDVVIAVVMKCTVFRDITLACHLLSRWFLARLILRP